MTKRMNDFCLPNPRPSFNRDMPSAVSSNASIAGLEVLHCILKNRLAHRLQCQLLRNTPATLEEY